MGFPQMNTFEIKIWAATENPARGSFKGSVLVPGDHFGARWALQHCGPQLSGGSSDFHLLVEHRPSELVLSRTPQHSGCVNSTNLCRAITKLHCNPKSSYYPTWHSYDFFWLSSLLMTSFCIRFQRVLKFLIRPWRPLGEAKKGVWIQTTSGGLGLLDRHVSEELLLLALNQISDLRSNQNVFVLTALCISQWRTTTVFPQESTHQDRDGLVEIVAAHSANYARLAVLQSLALVRWMWSLPLQQVSCRKCHSTSAFRLPDNFSAIWIELCRIMLFCC